MNIHINGESRDVPDSTTLLQTLISLQIVDDATDRGINSRKGIAVAVNDTVIRQSAWASTALHQHDHVLIITATQGG